MRTTVKTQGFAELGAALQELKSATAKNVLKRTAIAALEPMAADMRARAPVQKGGDADLKQSITVTDKLGPRQKRLTKKTSTVEAYAGPAGEGSKGAPPQGVFQEFGTDNHAPQPFMRPAWDTGKDALLDRAKVGLADEIEKARQRAARKALKAKR